MSFGGEASPSHGGVLSGKGSPRPRTHWTEHAPAPQPEPEPEPEPEAEAAAVVEEEVDPTAGKLRIILTYNAPVGSKRYQGGGGSKAVDKARRDASLYSGLTGARGSVRAGPAGHDDLQARASAVLSRMHARRAGEPAHNPHHNFIFSETSLTG